MRCTPSSIPSSRWETERRRRVRRSMSAAEGRFNAPIASSCAWAAFSRASEARPIAPFSSGFSNRSRQRPAEAILGTARQAVAQALRCVLASDIRLLLLSVGRLPGTGGCRTAQRGYGASVAERLFLFLQLEFPWELGPPDGRYLLRERDGGGAERVVVLGTAGRRSAPRAARAPARRLRRATPEPAPVPTTRATLIDPVPVSAESQARTWLAQLDAHARRTRPRRCSTASCTPTASPPRTPTCARSPRRRRS